MPTRPSRLRAARSTRSPCSTRLSPDAVKAGLVKIDGDPRKLDELLSMLDTFKVMFEVVEPKTARQ